MSKVGYYRYKTKATDGRLVAMFKDSVQAGYAEIKCLDFCEGFKRVKFLDEKGRYLYWSFTKYTELRDSPKQIGSTNEFITSIRTDQTNSKNIGYKNSRSVTLSSFVDSEVLGILAQIYSSPRVYYYVGDGSSDLVSDWVEVDSVRGDNLVSRSRQRNGMVTIELTLPEWFTIKMI